MDLHFHGAFGIDLMTCSPSQMDELSRRLWREGGVAGFVATTLSVERAPLRQAVERMGEWISQRSRKQLVPSRDGAHCFGIHLEGPFISPRAGGAHPPDAIRRLNFDELAELWEASRHTLKILTIAPEELSEAELTRLCEWAKRRSIVLSIGHTCATEAQAARAFQLGFQNVTHAWNAMKVHHRDSGVLGAALGHDDRFVELIMDRAHVSDTHIRWTLQLHPRSTCMVSDCVPAAATQMGSPWKFGDLDIEFDGQACRLRAPHPSAGALAGGGVLLPETYARWLGDESATTGESAKKIFARTRRLFSESPLLSLGIPRAKLARYRLDWMITPSSAPGAPAKIAFAPGE